MLQRLQSYSRAFWTLIACFFFNRIAAALVWPFMVLFIRTQTGAPLASITLLLSIQAVASIIGTSIISAMMDKYGRKRLMLPGMVAYSVIVLLMSQADTLWQWALLIALYGNLQPVFYIGANAMVADLVEPEKRTGAYALLRTVSNVAIAIGPAVGGIFIVQSHLFAYVGAALMNLVLLVPVMLYIDETLPKKKRAADPDAGGFNVVLRDRTFMTFIGVFTLLEICAAMTFNLLAVYVHEQYNITEDVYGRLVAINALMVVIFQYGVTLLTRKYAPFPVIALGCCFYVVGMLGFSLARTFDGFALAIIILTTGELMAMPTATAYVANIALPEMRARYMGVLSLTYTIGTGVGPMIGGFLGSAFFPAVIWYAGAVASVLAAIGFLFMWRMRQMVLQPVT